LFLSLKPEGWPRIFFNKLSQVFINSTSQYEESNDSNKIVAGTELTGDVVSDSNFILDGEMVGSLSCSGKVTLGSAGKLTGNLVCVDAEIHGSVEGDITVENLLALNETARIKGDIQSMKLIIQEGAIFEGSCVMKSPTTHTPFSADVTLDD
jgi:cytoskeletal protein CcmA (bactofilin family)